MSSYPTRNRKFKKNSKKFKKLKTNILATFKAKISWEWPRKREKKKIVPRSSYHRKFQKNRKNIQKIRKHYYGFFSSQNMLGKAEKVRKKKNHSDDFLPDLQ